MLYSHAHDQLYIYICMQNHNNAIKMSGHSSLEKYTSHFIWKGQKGYYCVRGELETEQNCSMLTPTLLAITAFLSRFPAAAQPGAHSSIFSPANLNFLSPGLYNNLTCTCFMYFCTQFNPSTVKVALDLLISSTGCTCYLHWCIFSFDSLVGSEVNMQQMCSCLSTIVW